MITINNKEYRNLQEQVLKNKEDIARHYAVDRVLADWGIKVLGVISSVDSIPEAEYDYGDAFGLSTTSPMQYVVWTRANNNVGEPDDYWLNIGALSLVGPRGPQGPQGIQGIQGVRGSIWYSSSAIPTPSTAYNTGDEWLHTSTGDVYRYYGRDDGSGLAGYWSRSGNIRGPQGVQGPTGPQGIQGIQGPTGPQGAKGDAGQSFRLLGKLASTDLLPTPTEEYASKAYAVGTEEDYDMYVIIPDEDGTLLWTNMGRISGVEGPVGPAGPQGPAGADIQIVYITGIPSTATQGTLTQDEVNTLLAHPSNYIQFFNENFYPQDVETDLGYIVYSHLGRTANEETKIKNISVTIATGGWVLTETAIGGEIKQEPPITVINTLPTANEENYFKGKFYTEGDLLKYINRVPSGGGVLKEVCTFPYSMSDTSAAAVGTNAYIFGGSKSSSSSWPFIYKYDALANTFTKLSTQLPRGLDDTSAASVGTNIYVFGGSAGDTKVNTIYKYDTLTDTITTMSTVLPERRASSQAITMGTDIYVIVGSAIYKYDTTTDSIITMPSTMPEPVASHSSEAMGTDIYTFGGISNGSHINSIYKYDTLTDTVTKMTATLPYGIAAASSGVIGTDIYIFGGNSSHIYKYDTLTDTLTTVGDMESIGSASSATIGSKIYLFGGISGGPIMAVNEYSLNYDYSYKTIANLDAIDGALTEDY